MQTIIAKSERPEVIKRDGNFESLLETICADPVIENEWIDLLSQLEFVGCRKIVRSVPYDKIDLSILQHISEEASHAFLLKSVCTPNRSSTWGESRLSPIGWRYFQALDRRVSELADAETGCYPAVSWAVERRVLWMYPIYETHTRNERLRRVLQRILAQEKRHGKQFEAMPFSESFRDTVVDIELELWEDFCSSIQRLLCVNSSNE